MRPVHLIALILVLLAFTLPASPAHAVDVVSVCDEGHLLAALAGGGTVTFVCSGTITLTATITIGVDTSIDGTGQTVTISGNHTVRVFLVNSGLTLNLNDVTVANGSGPVGDGILSYGRVTVSNSTFSGNNNAIDNTNGTLTVSNSTFSGNSAWFGGGGIYNQDGGTATVSNSTFSGNSASYYGGGIYVLAGTVTVINSTFSGNSASQGGGIMFIPGAGTVTLKNTIVANSPLGGNCLGPISDGGGNLSYPDTTCPGINGDPSLVFLRDNGGPTKTMALLSHSAALDAANDAICAAAPVNNLDQRGFPRPAGPHCDIGAYEGMIELPDHTYLPIVTR